MLVDELVPEVLKAIPRASLPTYRIGIVRLSEAHGRATLGEVTLAQLQRLRDRTQEEVGTAKVERARRTGRRLRNYDPAAHGKGAAENLVRAVRFFFRYACAAEYVVRSPAEHLTAPPRPPAPERPLTEAELAQVWQATVVMSRDHQLDELLMTFLRHTAARRGGCLALTLDGLHPTARSVTLCEKNGESRDVPLSAGLISRLQAIALQRGARAPSDKVFRYSNTNALTRRHFNTLFDRVDRQCPWAEPLDVGAHWIRHTTLSDIAAIAGLRVAAAYAGHLDESVGVIGLYTKVPFEDLVAAYESLFGPRG